MFMFWKLKNGRLSSGRLVKLPSSWVSPSRRCKPTRVAHSDIGTLVVDTGHQNAWFSTDGIAWNPVEPPPVTVDSGIPLHLSLYAASEGFVATDRRTNTWYHSIDGTKWDSITLPATFIGSLGQASSWGFEQTPFGYFAAGPNGLWYSPDGLDWQQEVLATDRAITSFAASSKGMVAFGVFADDSARWWYSSNGLDWAEVDDPGFTPKYGLARVAASDAGFFAIVRPDQVRQGEPAISGWYSADGHTWSVVPYIGDDTVFDGLRGFVPTTEGVLIYGGYDHGIWIYEH